MQFYKTGNKLTDKEKQEKELPSITEQLEAIWKQLESDKNDGKSLVPEVETILSKISVVKNKYGK